MVYDGDRGHDEKSREESRVMQRVSDEPMGYRGYIERTLEVKSHFVVYVSGALTFVRSDLACCDGVMHDYGMEKSRGV